MSREQPNHNLLEMVNIKLILTETKFKFDSSNNPYYKTT